MILAQFKIKQFFGMIRLFWYVYFFGIKYNWKSYLSEHDNKILSYCTSCSMKISQLHNKLLPILNLQYNNFALSFVVAYPYFR